MKNIYTKRFTALLLSLVVMMSMCFAGTAAVFADSGDAARLVEAAPDFGTAEVTPEAEPFAEAPLMVSSKGVSTKSVPTGSTVDAENLNTSDGTLLNTPEATASKDFQYKVSVREAGTLVIKYLPLNSSGEVSGSAYDSVSRSGSSIYTADSLTASDGTKIRMYTVEPGVYDVTFSLYSPTSATSVFFMAMYAPASLGTVKAPSGSYSQFYYFAGPADNSTVKTFKVTAPANGYLVMDLQDSGYGYSVYMKTSGFKGYESISKSNIRRTIGVKKGTYTFSVKSYAAVYQYRVRFYKVTENKYGTKKSKAVTIKKKKASKGLIITNSKKAHWYKFKNPKLQKVTIATTTKLNGGGKSGGVRITVYGKKGKIGSKIIYSDTASASFKLYTVGKKNKLVKGTYWIKIESYNGGNGYFTVKWK